MEFRWAMDMDNSLLVIPTPQDIAEMGNRVHTKTLKAGEKYSFSFTPRICEGTQDINGYNYSKIGRKQWVDCANTTVVHNGISYMASIRWNEATDPVAVDQPKFNVRYRYYFSCANPR